MLDIQEFKNFGRVVKLTDGEHVALITVDLGPRIIWFGTEEFNFLYEDVDRAVRNDAFDWKLYGGHRIWKSPELDDTYVPDNHPIEFCETEGGAQFVQPAHVNGLKAVLTAGFKDGKFVIENKLEKVDGEPVNAALWALTVMRQNGTLYISTNTKDTGLLPNRNMALWPYNDLTDPRFSSGETMMVLRQRPDIKRAFKVGVFLDDKRAFYATEGGLLSMTFSEGESNAKTDLGYTDFTSNFETYTSELILEIEGLTSVKKLEKGDWITMTETWEIFPNFHPEDVTEDAVEAALEKLGLKEKK